MLDYAHKFLAMCCISMMLAASTCSFTPFNPDATPEARAASRESIRISAIAIIEKFNAEGLDPIKVPPDKLAYVAAACVAATAILTVVDTGIPDAPQTVIATCDVVMKALAEGAATAAPDESPMPTEKTS